MTANIIKNVNSVRKLSHILLRLYSLKLFWTSLICEKLRVFWFLFLRYQQLYFLHMFPLFSSSLYDGVHYFATTFPLLCSYTVCLSLSLSLSLSLLVWLTLYLCLCLRLSVFLSLFLSLSLLLSLSLFLSLYLSFSHSFYLRLPHSNSDSQINMLQDDYCNVLCQVDLKSKDVTDFKLAIKRQYHHNWIVDNLPAASIMDSAQYVTTQYVGYPVGYLAMDQKTSYIYNHVNIILEYHTVEADGHRIVGFSVEPLSVKHTFASGTYVPPCTDLYP